MLTSKKIGVLSALAVLASQAGIAGDAVSQEMIDGLAACEDYENVSDVLSLQEELARLIDADPTNPCIDYLVARLGGSPVAQVQVSQSY